jgi:uncharacterized protein (TIGR03435 family)
MKYDFYCSVPSAKWEEIRPIAEQLVASSFQIRVQREKRATDVFVLSAPDGKPSTLAEAAPAPGVMMSSKSSILLPGAQVASLIVSLEIRLQRPVIDETGLTGWYRMRFSFQRDKPELLPDAVRTDLGLTIQPGRRQIEFLVVSNVQ